MDVVSVPAASLCSPTANGEVAESKLSSRATVLGTVTGGTAPTLAEDDTVGEPVLGSSAAGQGGSTSSFPKASRQLSSSIRWPKTRHRLSGIAPEVFSWAGRGSQTR